MASKDASQFKSLNGMDRNDLKDIEYCLTELDTSIDKTRELAGAAKKRAQVSVQKNESTLLTALSEWAGQYNDDEDEDGEIDTTMGFEPTPEQAMIFRKVSILLQKGIESEELRVSQEYKKKLESAITKLGDVMESQRGRLTIHPPLEADLPRLLLRDYNAPLPDLSRYGIINGQPIPPPDHSMFVSQDFMADDDDEDDEDDEDYDSGEEDRDYEDGEQDGKVQEDQDEEDQHGNEPVHDANVDDGEQDDQEDSEVDEAPRITEVVEVHDYDNDADENPEVKALLEGRLAYFEYMTKEDNEDAMEVED